MKIMKTAAMKRLEAQWGDQGSIAGQYDNGADYKFNERLSPRELLDMFKTHAPAQYQQVLQKAKADAQNWLGMDEQRTGPLHPDDVAAYHDVEGTRPGSEIADELLSAARNWAQTDLAGREATNDEEHFEPDTSNWDIPRPGHL